MALSESRLGQAAGAGDVNALFLKQFAGEVITAFETANVMMPLHVVRTISSGKTAQFPVIGTAEAKYHTAGNSIIVDETRAAVEHNERVIGIDDLLVSAAFIDSLDEAKNHYDFRSEYTRKLGYALAKKADEQLLSVVQVASEASAAAPQGAGGGDVEIDGTYGSTAAIPSAKLISAMFDCAVKLDEANVPDTDRFVILGPQAYYNLLSNGTDGFDIAKTVANSDIGGTGFGSGRVPMVAGFEIYKSNNLPTSGAAGDSQESGVSSSNDYTADSGGLKGVAFHRSAVGTVKLKDMALESEYQIERQGTLMVAKYAMGHGVLRPEAAISIVDKA